jgi:hypothetical protein
MKKHYETHVEDTDKLISVAGPILEYKSWYEQYRKLMEEQAQRKYGLYTPTSEGDEDDFPSISGMIARYSALGLTNEQMKENPVWVDKTGNGHDLQLKNFLWGEMRGVGGYKLNWGDFSIWGNYITQGAYGTGEVTDNIIHITSVKTNNALFETKASLKSVEYKVLIKGLTDDIYLRYGVFNDGKELWTEIKNDGIYTLPSYDYDSRYNMKWKVMSQTYPIDCNITIEQLPLYPGFILGDGVDDFAVTEKELNFEDTYTVYTAFIPFQDDPTRNMILCGADSKKTFSMQYSSLVYVSFIAGNNYYINANFVNGFNLFACKRNGNNICIKNLLTNKVVTGTCGDWVENAGLYYLWKNATYASFARAAIAGQTICNGYFSTDEDDEKVLDWYKKQYPWLFPDQAWTVVGKTNEDEDRATIANITGNGNDLVLSNFGFAEGSGYNEEGQYAGYLVTDGVDDMIISSVFKMGKDFTVVGEWVLLQNINTSSLRKDGNFVIRNHEEGISMTINRTSPCIRVHDKSLKAFCSNGAIYKSDWTEQIDTTPQSSTGGSSQLMIAGRERTMEYDKIAFKNLAIYPTVLSKDDCIKAYNYLQTLKAK